MESKRTVLMKGNPLSLAGTAVKVGEKAPDFTATANDLAEVSLASFSGKTCILLSVPSLDTPVCDVETRRFNKEASSLGENVVIAAVSMDLPFAQKRWCGAAGVENVRTLSDHRDASFGTAYGVLIEKLRLLARAVFVVDKEGILRYAQLVEEVASEPNYEEVLEAVEKIV